MEIVSKIKPKDLVDRNWNCEGLSMDGEYIIYSKKILGKKRKIYYGVFLERIFKDNSFNNL